MIKVMENQALLVCSGDLRPSANLSCWPTQQAMEEKLSQALAGFGWHIKRAHDFKPDKGHGFIDYQIEGLRVFREIDPNAPLIVAESVWQYSQHILAGLISHQGPILIIANWDGQFPGLVGALNLTGSLTKANVKYSFLWSEDFEDPFFLNGLQEWLETGTINHINKHVRKFDRREVRSDYAQIADDLSSQVLKSKVIMGVFDEGCMGMFNAIVPDHLLHPLGFFKERLSQSTLYAKMRTITDDEALLVLNWLLEKGVNFHWGADEDTELTTKQSLEQCKMYVAALRLADEYGCGTIGIQYQQGLKDLVAASDLVEGLLNNTERPPVINEVGREILAGEALPHFNEVDECAGIDSYITYHLWRKFGMEGDNTLHDLRYGAPYKLDGDEEFVWVLLISGAAPASHFIDGYAGAESLRQPSMFFKKGGGTLRGISKPGNIVWSRIFIEDNVLKADVGTGRVPLLPAEETERRWNMTNPEWPIMHAVFDGVSKDQMMAKHKSNHVQVVYVDDEHDCEQMALAKARAFQNLGIQVNICGF